MSSETVVAIVDPYSSGVEMARQVKMRGHPCLMVQSLNYVPQMYRSTCKPQYFNEIIVHHGDLQETAATLQARDTGCLFAGSEVGVELADQLSERLGLISNGSRLSEARRNKWQMSETLARAGLRVPFQFASPDLQEIRQRVHDRGIWPVVLKPLCSSGSDGVALCSTDAEILRSYETIMNHRDVFGKTNQAVLVQEFLTGTQYAVDTVSYAGQHKLAAIWQYGKRPAAGGRCFRDDSLELLDFGEAPHQQLLPYVTAVLDALEIRFGPAHCELMLSAEGPIIVEIGARIHGGHNPLLSQYCGERSQIDLTLDAYLDPERFLADVSRPYALTAAAMRVFLIPREPEHVKALRGVEQLQHLASYREMHISSTLGRNPAGVAGWVLLVHQDRATVHRDLQQIRQLEADGFYQLET
jgi:biotin carboxylase